MASAIATKLWRFHGAALAFGCTEVGARANMFGQNITCTDRSRAVRCQKGCKDPPSAVEHPGSFGPPTKATAANRSVTRESRMVG